MDDLTELNITEHLPIKSRSENVTADRKKNFDVSFYHDWCKSCGICMAFCPQKIIRPSKEGKPEILDKDACVGCRFCEMHCPDFAITVSERKPYRRTQQESGDD